MKVMFTIDIAILLALGFVPNQRSKNYHMAKVTIGGHTVWAKNFAAAHRIASRVVGSLYRRGFDVRYRVEDQNGNYEYNW